MTESESAAPFNSASDGAHVDVQAETVYGVSIVHNHLSPYDLPDEATAEQRFLVGVENLKGGKASAARRFIWDAKIRGYQRPSEARFYWLIAMLSGRTIADFSDEEIFQLRGAEAEQPAAPDDSWADGAHLVFHLLRFAGVLPVNPRPNLDEIMKGVDCLSSKQRDLLLPHLELFLDDQRKDDVWEKQRSNAETGQSAANRKNRAWMFFHPDPAPLRARRVEPITTTRTQVLSTRTWSVIFAGAVGFFGWELLWHDAVLGLLAYLACLASATMAASVGREVRFLAERRRQEEVMLKDAQASMASSPSGNGFTAQVDRFFNLYTARYVPAAERTAWKAATAGILKSDRDEIVTEYRETRIPAERVAWLVKHRIRRSLADFRSGELYDFRQKLRPKSGAVTVLTASAAIGFLAGIAAIAALWSHPLVDVVTVMGALLSGRQAWRGWLDIYFEQRRFAEDATEREQRLESAQQEFLRWSRRLKPRPNDAEMETWLECDRTVLLAKAIDHYRLARHQVIAHAFLEDPGPRTNRARVHNGPTRYSRYNLIVFLLTAAGVRQISADLLFLRGEIRLGARVSYRYDAVASAHVSLAPQASQSSRMQQAITLTLVNGAPTTAIITDIDPGEIREGETETSLEAAQRDAARVNNTLHLLEGIAAEGKAWIQHRKPGLSRHRGRKAS